MFKDKPKKKLRQGDLKYEAARSIIAWLGKRDVDSNLHKVLPNTRDLLVVYLGNNRISSKISAQAIGEIFDLIKGFAPQASLAFCKELGQQTGNARKHQQY